MMEFKKDKQDVLYSTNGIILSGLLLFAGSIMMIVNVAIFVLVLFILGILFNSVGIFIGLITLTAFIIRKKEVEKKKIRESIDLKTLVRDFMKTEGKIELKYLSKTLGIRQDELRIKINNIVGSGKFGVTFHDGYFIANTNSDKEIEDFIDVLDAEFNKWKNNDQTKLNK